MIKNYILSMFICIQRFSNMNNFCSTLKRLFIFITNNPYICTIKYYIFCDYLYIIRKGIEAAGRSRQLRKTISVT